MKEKLTTKQRLFVEAYCGNAAEAARKAGYSEKTAFRIGVENMQKPAIIEALKKRNAEMLSPLIASRMQRQEFWSKTMNDAEEDIRARLKASELLGKSEGDFLERLEHAGPGASPLCIQVIRFSGDDKGGAS